LGAGLTIQPCKKVIVTKLKKGRPCNDDDDDDDAINVIFLQVPAIVCRRR
jgi:hypothetical protein